MRACDPMASSPLGERHLRRPSHRGKANRQKRHAREAGSFAPRFGRQVAAFVVPTRSSVHGKPISITTTSPQARHKVIVADAGVLEVVDDWFKTAPYQAAFSVTAFKATLADFLTQQGEIRAAEQSRSLQIEKDLALNVTTTNDKVLVETCDDVSCEIVEVEVSKQTLVETCDDVSCEVIEVTSPQGTISWPRNLAFLFYGGLYQGCVQYYLFNDCYSAWFGDGDDLVTLCEKVLFDQLVLTPFLCLPVAYVMKAIAFRYSVAEGLRRYFADAKRDLLLKYWAIWTPVQCVTFGFVPAELRIPFIAVVSFFWLIILSSISSRDDAQTPVDAVESSS